MSSYPMFKRGTRKPTLIQTMKVKLLVIASAVTLACSSCATIFTGSKAKVIFDSEQVKENVDITVDGYKYKHVTLPYTVKVKKGFNESIIKAEAEGYRPYVLIIDKIFNPVSILNLTDIIGWGIDAATGAMMRPEYKYYDLEFKKQDDKKEE